MSSTRISCKRSPCSWTGRLASSTSLLSLSLPCYTSHNANFKRSSVQYFVAASSVYSLAFFQPIILRQGMGFSYTLSQILSSPPYLFAIIASLAFAWLSDKIKLRWPILIAQSMFAIVGLLIVLYTKPPGVRYFGLFLATFGTQANVPASLAYGQNQTARVSKRGIVAAAMISVGAAGGITGSTIFQSKDAPVSEFNSRELRS
jgi:MFS family permease